MEMANSVVGYLPDSIAKGLSKRANEGALHVHLERGR